MYVIECRKCGAPIEVEDGRSVAKCEYCQSMNTVSSNSDNQEAYNRADYLRRNNEFDKALRIYEELLIKDKSDYEAHWGYVLSKYGIEYVEDPLTKDRKPTCHRLQESLFTSDADYKAAVEHAPFEVRLVYEKDAEEIVQIQKKIWEFAKKQDKYDVFICYKEQDDMGSRTTDSVSAQEIYYDLERAGYKVFFARQSLANHAGEEYEPIIYSALQSAKVMILIGSCEEYVNAVWVKNEWSRYLALTKNDKDKHIIPCLIKMKPEELPPELSNLQAIDLNKIGATQDVIDGVKKLFGNNEGTGAAIQSLIQDKEKRDKKKKKAVKAGIIAAPFVVIALVIAITFNSFWKPLGKYMKAAGMANDHKYQEAIDEYTALGDFMKSPDKVKQTYYEWGDYLNEAGEIESAIDKYSNSNGYSDSEEKIKECRYLLGVNRLEKENYELAYITFYGLEDYKDCYDLRYIIAEKMLANQDAKRASEMFYELNGYSDSEARYYEACFKAGDEYLESGNIESAIRMFAVAKDGAYDGASSKYDEACAIPYNEAKSFYDAGKYGSALKKLNQMGEYKYLDSVELKAECKQIIDNTKSTLKGKWTSSSMWSLSGKEAELEISVATNGNVTAKFNLDNSEAGLRSISNFKFNEDGLDMTFSFNNEDYIAYLEGDKLVVKAENAPAGYWMGITSYTNGMWWYNSSNGEDYICHGTYNKE